MDITEQRRAAVVAQHPPRRAAVAGATNEIGIVLYPGVQAACVLGLTDLFGIAAGIALDQRRDGRSPLRVTHWQPAHNHDTKLSCVYDSDPRGSSQPRILIIPPTLVDLPNPDVSAGVVPWLRSRHAEGAKLVSVCSGAFILAATGLVAGHSVSTHRICAEALAKRFPEITVDTNQRIIDDGDIITAGGFLAWVDVGLLLVDRLLGGAISAETARFILSDPAATAAGYFPGFAPKQTHGDTAVPEGSGVGAYQRWPRCLSRLHGGGGRIGKAHLPPPVRECNGNDADRILSSCSHCASARASGVRQYPAKVDGPVPRVQGRRFVCTRFSQGHRIGPGSLPEKVRP